MNLKVLFLCYNTAFIITSCGPGCSNCSEEGNDLISITIIVELPEVLPSWNDPQCVFDNPPFNVMQGTGVPACCIFGGTFFDLTKHYIDISISGECFSQEEFSLVFKGAKYATSTGCSQGCDFGGNIEIKPYQQSPYMQFCIEGIPRSLHHGFIDYNLSLTYRTMCSSPDPTCYFCKPGQHFYGYFRFEGLLTSEYPLPYECYDPNKPWEGGLLFLIEANQFSTTDLTCSNTETCLP